MRLLIMALFAFVLLLGGSPAKAADTVSADQNLATTKSITTTDLEIPAPSFWEVNSRKFLRFFTLSETKKAKYSYELAKMTLFESRQALEEGDIARATELLDSYNKQIVLISASLETITNQFKDTSNTEALAVIEKIQQTKMMEVSLLDSMNIGATNELNKKILEIRSQSLKDLTKVLSKPNMTDEERSKKIAKILKKLESKELKIEDKYSRKISAIDDLEQASDDDDLDKLLDDSSDKELANFAKEGDEESFQKFALNITDHTNNDLVVLQELINKVPDSAKPAIQAKIDKEIEKLSKDIKSNKKKIEDEVTVNNRNIEVKREILKKIEEANIEGSDKKVKEAVTESQKMLEEVVKKELELQLEQQKKQEEAIKKEQELKLEEQKKQEETAKEETKESTER